MIKDGEEVLEWYIKYSVILACLIHWLSEFGCPIGVIITPFTIPFFASPWISKLEQSDILPFVLEFISVYQTVGMVFDDSLSLFWRSWAHHIIIVVCIFYDLPEFVLFLLFMSVKISWCPGKWYKRLSWVTSFYNMETPMQFSQIGRASWRESVCQFVYTSLIPGKLSTLSHSFIFISLIF